MLCILLLCVFTVHAVQLFLFFQLFATLPTVCYGNCAWNTKTKNDRKNCQSQKFIDCIRNNFFLGFVARHSSLYRTWAKFMCCRRVRCTNVTKFARMYLSLTRIGMYKSPPNKKTHQNKSEHAELQEYPVWLFDCNPTSTINNQHNNQK